MTDYIKTDENLVHLNKAITDSVEFERRKIMEGLRGPDGINSVTAGGASGRTSEASNTKKPPNSVWAENKGKKLRPVKLDIPTEPPKLADGANYNDITTHYFSTAKYDFPETNGRNQRVKMYKDSTTNEKGEFQGIGKPIATHVHKDGKNYFIDANKRQFVEGEDGKLVPYEGDLSI